MLVLEDHYIHTSEENKALDTEYFWPIQTYIQVSKPQIYSLIYFKVRKYLPWVCWGEFLVHIFARKLVELSNVSWSCKNLRLPHIYLIS